MVDRKVKRIVKTGKRKTDLEMLGIRKETKTYLDVLATEQVPLGASGGYNTKYTRFGNRQVYANPS